MIQWNCQKLSSMSYLDAERSHWWFKSQVLEVIGYDKPLHWCFHYMYKTVWSGISGVLDPERQHKITSKTLDFFQALHEFDFWRTLVSLFFSFLVCAAALCNKLNFSSSLLPGCWNLAVWAEIGREKGGGCVIRSVSVHRNVPAKFKYFWTKE